MHASLRVGRDDRQNQAPARAATADLRPQSSKEQRRRFLVLQPSDVSECAELVAVSHVRRRGQQHHPSRSTRDRVQARASIGSRRRAVRFIDHDEIPSDILEWSQNLGPLHEVVRGHEDAGQRPGVDVRRAVPLARSQPGCVRERCTDAEVCGQLAQPLLTQAGGNQHERAKCVGLRRELEQHEAGLNRLAKTDLVCQQQSRHAVAKHRKGRFELIGHQADRRARGGLERSERMLADEGAIEMVKPTTRSHHARGAVCFERSGSIEWNQKGLPLDAARLLQAQRGAVCRCGDCRDRAAPAPHEDAVSNSPSGL